MVSLLLVLLMMPAAITTIHVSAKLPELNRHATSVEHAKQNVTRVVHLAVIVRKITFLAIIRKFLLTNKRKQLK